MLTQTHFDHFIPAAGMLKAESGERKVSFARSPGLREFRQMYVVAHFAHYISTTSRLGLSGRLANCPCKHTA